MLVPRPTNQPASPDFLLTSETLLHTLNSAGGSRNLTPHLPALIDILSGLRDAASIVISALPHKFFRSEWRQDAGSGPYLSILRAGGHADEHLLITLAMGERPQLFIALENRPEGSGSFRMFDPIETEAEMRGGWPELRRLFAHYFAARADFVALEARAIELHRAAAKQTSAVSCIKGEAEILAYVPYEIGLHPGYAAALVAVNGRIMSLEPFSGELREPNLTELKFGNREWHPVVTTPALRIDLTNHSIFAISPGQVIVFPRQEWLAFLRALIADPEFSNHNLHRRVLNAREIGDRSLFMSELRRLAEPCSDRHNEFMARTLVEAVLKSRTTYPELFRDIPDTYDQIRALPLAPSTTTCEHPVIAARIASQRPLYWPADFGSAQ